MPRLKLNPLENYPFSTDITVRTTDLNYGGHLGNDRLISLVHEARVAFLTRHGFSEKDFGGVSLIAGDMAVVYLGEAFAGDVLRFEVAAGEPTRCGFRLFFRITRPADNTPLPWWKTGWPVSITKPARFNPSQKSLNPSSQRLTPSAKNNWPTEYTEIHGEKNEDLPGVLKKKKKRGPGKIGPPFIFFPLTNFS